VPNDRNEKKPLDDASLTEKQLGIKAVLQARLGDFANIKPVNAR
jgi:hypothetical protein